MARDKLNQDQLKDLLEYDSRTGIFRWRVSASPQAISGVIAGWLDNGYRRIMIGGKAYRSARLAWLYETGSWPKGCVDHIDRNRANDRFANLRDVSHRANIQNWPRKNKAGFRGIYKRGKKYVAQIGVAGGVCHLGTYKTAYQAHQIYKQVAVLIHGPDASTDCK